MDVKIALIGGGNVGQGFLSILRDKSEIIASQFGLSFQLVSISDLLAGSILSTTGLKITDILPIIEDGHGLMEYQPKGQTFVKGLDPVASIELSKADAVIECTYSDLQTGEPASTYIRKALSMRKHVITTNKGPITLHYSSLNELARTNGVKLRFEGTVMSGTPIIHLFSNSLLGETITDIRGILNSSTTFIFSSIEQGAVLEEAIKKAKEKGIMEANPQLDLEGLDSMAKLLILTNVMTRGELRPNRIRLEGVVGTTQKEILQTIGKGMRYRLVSHAWVENDGRWRGEVGPVKLTSNDPLFHISETRCAVIVKTENLGEILIEGPGTGKMETGSAILSDLLSLYIS